jgi:hypothetical protein
VGRAPTRVRAPLCLAEPPALRTPTGSRSSLWNSEWRPWRRDSHGRCRPGVVGNRNTEHTVGISFPDHPFCILISPELFRRPRPRASEQCWRVLGPPSTLRPVGALSADTMTRRDARLSGRGAPCPGGGAADTPRHDAHSCGFRVRCLAGRAFLLAN